MLFQHLSGFYLAVIYSFAFLEYPCKSHQTHCTQVSVLYQCSTRENLSSGVCEQHRRRPACAFVQSDQRLCFSLTENYSI